MKRKKLFFVILLPLLLFSQIIAKVALAAVDCSNTATTGVPQTECQALVSLYTSTNGSSWASSTNWNTNTSIGTWKGVSVSGGHVTQINLFNNNLSGSLPDNWASLPNLTSLMLHSNSSISGAIPPSIGSLANLKTLWLGSNFTPGPVPDNFSNLTGLTSLSLASCRLTGSIPSWVTQATGLTALSFYYNPSLTGGIPNDIGNLTNLTSLSLGGTNIGGAIPSSLNSLTKLTTLDLSASNLTGALPDFSALINLTSLKLYKNNFNCQIPSWFGGFTKLTLLDISTSTFSGAIPADLGNLTKLTSLIMSGNQLSGPIPSSVGASATTSVFKIDNNNFVFSDFEPQFSVYTSKSNFVYSPQAMIGPSSSVTVKAGKTLNITPSLAENANDHYQWYYNGSQLSGATNRIFTKSNVQDIDYGSYTYQVTNSVVTGLTLRSNTTTVAVTPNRPADDKVYYLRSGNNVWIRGRISANKDIAQQYSLETTGNNNINFRYTYIISSTTPNNINAYQTGVSPVGAGDDTAPINTVNNGYMGENHGFLVPRVTSNSHGKTSADVGSVWSDEAGQRFVIASTTATTITFYPHPYSYMGSWKTPSSVSTNSSNVLTHVSGAAHTGDITINSQETIHSYPMNKNYSRQILINGSSPMADGAAGYADFVDFVQEFDMVDPSTIKLSNNPFIWNDADTWMHVNHVFRSSGGTTVIHSTYNVQRPMNVGYLGFIQTGPLVTDAGNSNPINDYNALHYYIPKTKTVNGLNFSNIEDFTSYNGSQINFTSDYLEDPNNPVDRQIEFLKRNGDNNYDIGFAFGFSPYLSTAAGQRLCANSSNTGCWWIYTSRKTYPVVVGSEAGIIATSSAATYDVYAYRQWIDPKETGIGKTAYWNKQNGHDLVYVDYHRSANNDQTVLPNNLLNKSIRVVESKNMVIPSSTDSNGVTLSTTPGQSYGYAVLELSNDIDSPTVEFDSPGDSTEISGTEVSLSATATDNVSVVGVKFLLDGDEIGQEITSAPYYVSWDTTGTANGQHSLSVVARDLAGNQATSTIVVNVNNSGENIGNITVSNISSSSLTIAWSTDQLASSYVDYGLTSQYGSYVGSSQSVIGSHQINLSGLLACTQYHYRARSINGLGVASLSSDRVFVTAGCSGSASVVSSNAGMINATGGSLGLSSDNANINLEIPSGFNDSAVNFQIKQLDRALFVQNINLPSDYQLIGQHIYNLQALTGATTSLTSFSHQLNITIGWRDQEVSGLDLDSLLIYRYDGNRWTALNGCQVDFVHKTISCPTSNFSDFVLLGKTAVVPVITSPDQNHLPADALLDPVKPAVGDFQVIINGNDATTSDRLVKLSLVFGLDTVNMAISEVEDFSSISLERAVPTKIFNLSSGLGQKNVFVKFYNRWGRSTKTYRAQIVVVAPDSSVIVADDGSHQTINNHSISFTSDLLPGMNETPVKLLQQMLNQLGLKLASRGPGSIGQETDYYGSATTAAVARLQKVVGIRNIDGKFSGVVRQQLNNILAAKYPDGLLVRFNHGIKIYVANNGQLDLVRSLSELSKYSGKEILMLNG